MIHIHCCNSAIIPDPHDSPHIISPMNVLIPEDSWETEYRAGDSAAQYSEAGTCPTETGRENSRFHEAPRDERVRSEPDEIRGRQCCPVSDIGDEGYEELSGASAQIGERSIFGEKRRRRITPILCVFSCWTSGLWSVAWSGCAWRTWRFPTMTSFDDWRNSCRYRSRGSL